MKRILLFLNIVFLCLQLHATESSEPTIVPDQAKYSLLTPDLAQRKTLKIILPNGLEAYLISDPKTDKSGAVLSVMVGSWDDPRDYPGLAHFLEHMLFLGTKKYPEESEYSRYITEHGGVSNAYTANSYTSFMFEVDNTAFSGALDRFAHFFIEPLFNPSGVSRELNAIDQEYAKNLENDDWRLLYVDKEIANPNHPYHDFNIGNSKTLAKVSREVFINWYQQHYSANLMHLMVVSSLPIDQLRDLVVSSFKEIPNNNKKPYDLDLPAMGEPGKMVYVEPVQDIRTLTLMWELPPQFVEMKDAQPATTVCYVIGHEGAESLLAELKREGLAEKLGCSKHKLGGKNSFFFIEIRLTDEGVKEVDRVIAYTFQALANLKAKEYPKYLFQEMQRMQVINYQYQPREDLFQYLMRNADLITNEDLATFPEQSLITQKFDPEAIKELLDVLTPQNAHFYLQAPSRLTHVTLNQHEKWLGADYAVKPLKKELLDKWAKETLHPAIELPAANPFIPQKLSVIDPTTSHEDQNVSVIPKPEMIYDNSLSKVYYAKDTHYRVPKISLIFQIKTPQIDMGNPAKIVSADLYVKSITENLSKYSYPALLAGLEYDIKRTDYGLSFYVGGYSENAHLLFEEILKQLKNVQPTEHEFDLYKNSLLRDYQNFAKKSPLEQALEALKSVLYKKFVTEKQKANSIQQVTYQKFNEYVADLFQQTFVEGIIYGDINHEDARSLTDKVLATVRGSVYPKDKRKRTQVILLPPYQGPFYLESPIKMQGNAVILAIENIQQPHNFNFKDRAAQQVLMQAIKEPFFTELRTQQQTAYLVYSDGLEIEKQLFELFAVQSNTHAVRDLLSRFELFIESYFQQLPQDVTEERFNVIKAALLHALEQPPKDVGDMGSLLQKIAFDYDGDFDWISKRIQGIKELTYEEFLKKANEMIGRTNHRRVAVLLKGIIPKEKAFNYTPLKSLSSLRRMSEYTDLKDE